MTFVSWLKTPLGLGIVTLALFAGAVVFGLNATHGMPMVPRKEVRVAFTDLSGLNVGDDVRIGGSRVGSVSDLGLVDGRPVATLKLDDPNTKLYENSLAARVTDRSSLGQKFVELDPGSPRSGPLRDDSIIPASQTEKAEDLGQLLDTLDPTTRDRASTFLKNFGGGMLGHGSDLHSFVQQAPQLLRDTGQVSSAVGDGRGVPLTSMLQAGDRLSGHLRARHLELAKLIDQFSGTVEAFDADSGHDVDAALGKAPDALESLDSALSSLDAPLQNTAVAMRTLRPGATALGRSTPNLRAFLRTTAGPLQKVPGVSQLAAPGVGSLTQVVTDARPLSAQLVRTGDEAAPLASVLGSYAWDVSNFYTLAQGALAQGDAAGNWLRILLLPGAESVASSFRTVPGDPYQPPTDEGSR